MPKNVDPILLIALVQAHPVLWDKTLATHKDQFQTTRAWNEVFMGLNSDFCNLNEDRKKIYGKEAMKKWVNIRDTFNKSRKKELEKSQSGHGRAGKRYIYADQLKFLLKLQHSKEDDMNAEYSESDEGDREWKPNQKPHNERLKRHKRQTEQGIPQPTEARVTVQQQEDRHLSFFKSITPSLNTFSDDESIQFQMGVLQLITDIKQSRLQAHMES